MKKIFIVIKNIEYVRYRIGVSILHNAFKIKEIGIILNNMIRLLIINKLEYMSMLVQNIIIHFNNKEF